MTHADKTCEVCGYTNYYAGVASASAPISVAWCHVCLAMGAEPDIVFMGEDPKKVAHMGHFDREQDRYFVGPEPLPIQMMDGREFETRGAMPDPEPDAQPPTPAEVFDWHGFDDKVGKT